MTSGTKGRLKSESASPRGKKTGQKYFRMIPTLPDSLVNLSYLLEHYPLLEGVLKTLLEDRTPGYGKKKKLCRNIVWATDSYAHLGAVFFPDAPITIEALKKLKEYGEDLRPRVLKRDDEQHKRSKERAEVFTPARICAKMNDFCDQDWFGRETPVFTKESPNGWECVDSYFDALKELDWQDYVKSRRLEITCGEAPFIVSRYDASTGERIPIEKRVGILDRKLRVVGAPKEESQDGKPKVADQDAWLEGARLAFQSVYGYEYQGDSLLIARINVFMTLIEYFTDRFDSFNSYEPLELEQAKSFANVIAWNFWQMNGLTFEAPGNPERVVKDIKESQAYFEKMRAERLQNNGRYASSLIGDLNSTVAKTRDWQREYTYYFCTKNHEGRTMKFDYVIGNPPYQDTIEGTSDPAAYNYFMDASYEVGSKVLLITPARFLFRAGKTPPEWNEKMLHDEHLKVVHYEPTSKSIFEGNDIKGGIAVTYRDENSNFGQIEAFFVFDELRRIFLKVFKSANFKTIDDDIVGQNKWDLTNLFSNHPEYKKLIGSAGKEKRLTAPIFTQIPVFTETGG